MVMPNDPQDVSVGDPQDVSVGDPQDVSVGDPQDVSVSDPQEILVGDIEGGSPEDVSPEEQAAVSISYKTASASKPKSGVAQHGSYITVPNGTTVNDWIIFISPRQMGDREVGSEKDNALLWFKNYASTINLYTWQVYARYKYRYWSSRDGVYLPDSRYPKGEPGYVHYLLIPRNP